MRLTPFLLLGKREREQGLLGASSLVFIPSARLAPSAFPDAHPRIGQWAALEGLAALCAPSDTTKGEMGVGYLGGRLFLIPFLHRDH